MALAWQGVAAVAMVGLATLPAYVDAQGPQPPPPAMSTTTTSSGYAIPTGTTTDPGLASSTLIYLPPYIWTLPAQIISLGISIALCGIILLHLLFTVRYHWPLAKFNWLLQASATVFYFIDLSLWARVINRMISDKVATFPFAIQLESFHPPPEGAVLVFTALGTALVHTTHIQFLTMLYPSKVEKWLIVILLGPLAILASTLIFTQYSPNQSLVTFISTVQSICNTTLTMLYTIALLVWGLVLNRTRAWRTDGGTLIFGLGATLLALLGVVIDFFIIFDADLELLKWISFVLILWQNWLGFWWYVGSRSVTSERLSKKIERKRAARFGNLTRRRDNLAQEAIPLQSVDSQSLSFRPTSSQGSTSAEPRYHDLPPLNLTKRYQTRPGLRGWINHHAAQLLPSFFNPEEPLIQQTRASSSQIDPTTDLFGGRDPASLGEDTSSEASDWRRIYGSGSTGRSSEPGSSNASSWLNRWGLSKRPWANGISRWRLKESVHFD